MLLTDMSDIGNRLHAIRKKKGYTQAETAELSEISDRAYADIERGSANMRVGTLIQICNALKVTPDDILVKRDLTLREQEDTITVLLEKCSMREKETALNLLEVYLHSLGY